MLTHIFENDYMDKYFSKEIYYGYKGYLKGVLTDMEDAICGKREKSNQYINNKRQVELKWINNIRDMSILDMKEEKMYEYLQKLALATIRELMKINNIKEEKDMIYRLEIFRFIYKDFIDMNVEFCDYKNKNKKIEFEFPKEYYDILINIGDIHKILNEKSIPILYRRLYFLNEIIGSMYVCENDINDKCATIEYDTYFNNVKIY